MIIDFEKIPVSRLANFNGGEREFVANIFNDERNKILRGVLEPGASIGYHCHATSSEIIFAILGKGSVLVNREETGMENAVREALCAGSCHYCPKGFYHSLINDGEEDLVFFAVVCQQ